MTSDSEDLEEQLRQNLKLRRELVAEVTSVRDRNAKDRLGWILYWTFIVLAGLWVLLWLGMLHGGLFGLQSAGVEHAIEVFMLNPFEQLISAVSIGGAWVRWAREGFLLFHNRRSLQIRSIIKSKLFYGDVRRPLCLLKDRCLLIRDYRGGHHGRAAIAD